MTTVGTITKSIFSDRFRQIYRTISKYLLLLYSDVRTQVESQGITHGEKVQEMDGSIPCHLSRRSNPFETHRDTGI